MGTNFKSPEETVYRLIAWSVGNFRYLLYYGFYSLVAVGFVLVFKDWSDQTELAYENYAREKEISSNALLGYLPVPISEKSEGQLFKAGLHLDPIRFQKDYLLDLYALGRSIENQDIKEYQDIFLDSANSNANKFFTSNLEKGLRRKSTIIDVRPTINSFANFQKFVSVSDTITSFVEVYGDGFSDTYVETALFNISLILSEGYWHFRHLSKEHSSQIPYFKKSQYQDSIFRKKDGQEFHMKGINYYAQKAPWKKFWTDWDAKVIQQDAQIMRKAGLNTVRIFLPFHESGGGVLKGEYWQKLTETLRIFEKEKIYVILTLFDFVGNYDSSQWLSHKYHLQQVVNSIKDYPSLLAYDLKNEPDLDFRNFRKPHILNWLKFVSTEIRKVDSITPQTIGWSKAEEAVQLKEYVDFVSFHYYEDPSEFDRAWTSLKSKIGKKPLVVSEFGKPSLSPFWNVFTNGQNVQNKYYEVMFREFEKKQLKHFLSWTLYDFDEVPNEVAGSSSKVLRQQANFGFIDSNGKPKKAFQWIDGKKDN